MSMIIDSHVHLWDATLLRLGWSGAGHLEGTHDSRAYRSEAEPLGIQRSVLIEVDVVAEQRRAEADDHVARCSRGQDGILASVPCLDPREDDFEEKAQELSRFPTIRGIRWIARTAEMAEALTDSARVRRNLMALGDLGLAFDLNVPTSHLSTLPRLVRGCPGTRFVLDHLGYADPEAFSRHPLRAPTHDPDHWRSCLSKLGTLGNLCCKISGLANRLPAGGCTSDRIAPIVEHARSAFGASRLLFGSDWPVVGPPGTLADWHGALQELSSQWAESERSDLWGGAAMRWYGLASLGGAFP